MSFRITPLAACVLAVACATPVTPPQTGTPAPAHPPFMQQAAGALSWNPIQPPGFDAGMEIAVVHGNPSVAGQPYVIRLRFRDGYRFPPHWHPVSESLTVLEGRFLLAMGERTDESRLQTYVPGDFLYIEGRHPHFGGATGSTTIQLHGTGPFDIVVVGSPQDRR